MTADELHDLVSSMVRAGYSSVSEIVESASECDELEDGCPSPSELEAIVVAKVKARREEQADRAPSYERLARAFAELSRRDVLARENFWCCQTCAYAAIDDEIAEEIAAGRAVRGYVLFHSQDTDRVVESGVLHLRYMGVTADPDAEGDDASAKLGAEIVAVLRAEAFEPEWSGSPTETIRLPMAWDKLPPTEP